MAYKVKRLLKKVGIIILVLIALIIIYSTIGFSKSNTEIDYTVTVNNTDRELEVKMTIHPNKLFFLDLFINNPRNKENDFRVRDFKVTRKDKSIAHWRTLPNLSNLERIWVGFNNSPISITYTVEPEVETGDRGKALSYLTEEYGYFRGMYILYTPITFKEAKTYLLKGIPVDSQPGVGSLQFKLPEGWRINNPWVKNSGKISIADMRNTYWATGRNMDIIQSDDISIGILDKTIEDKLDNISQNIDKIYNEIERLSQTVPKKDASYWSVSILPSVPIHGGVSGNYSLLSEYDIYTISHEIFHWWNGFTIKSNNEANWIQEGFTAYYGGKVLLKTGIWSKADFEDYIHKLQKQLWSDTIPKPVNLTKASGLLTKKSNSMEIYYQVYNGGALLAYYIDEQLQKENKSLDDLWLPLSRLGKSITDQDFLNTLSTLANKQFSDEIHNMIEGVYAIPVG